MPTLLDPAVELARRGWRVMPIGPNKRPLLKDWPNAATADETTIATWWTAGYRNCQIGIVCGRASDLVVVDVDMSKGDGEAGLIALQTKYGPLPDTITARTGGGGRHLYFKFPILDTIGNRAKLEGHSVDVRGEGGYVVAPPSIHDNGNRYGWIGDALECAHLPAAWVEFLAGQPADHPLTLHGQDRSIAPPDATTHRQAVDICMTRPPAISGSGGHAATYGVAVMLVHGLRLPPATALGLLATIYNPRCVPPWSDAELRHKVADAATKPHAEPYGWLVEPDDAAMDWGGATPKVDGATTKVAGNATPDVARLRLVVPDAATAGPPRRGAISNTIASKGHEDEPKTLCKPITSIAAELHDATAGWPRRVGGLLFAATPTTDPLPGRDCLRFFNKDDELFAWIQLRCGAVFFSVLRGGKQFAWDITGRHPSQPVSRKEFFEHMRQCAQPSYTTVEPLPHEPAVAGAYYVPCTLPQADGSALDELTEHLNPNTDLDGLLMVAALLTPGWGGPPGQRPGFIFNSPHGRGVGKSKTAELFGEIWGGWITLDETTKDWDTVKQRLLSDEALSKRVIMLDNVKRKLSGQEIESLIASPMIDGKRMYHGQFSRPNRLAFYITANSPQASTDIADRCVSVQVGGPRHAAAWAKWAVAFVESRRAAVIADLMAILAGPAKCEISPANADRWALWQEAILTRFRRGDELAAEIKRRRPEMDGEADEAAEVAEALRTELAWRGHTPATQVIRIGRPDMADILRNAHVVGRDMGVQGITTWVRGLSQAAALKAVLYERRIGRSGSLGARYWVWIGEEVARIEDAEQIDLLPFRPKQQ